MAAIPAPEQFTDLRQHLHDAEIDPAYLVLKLREWLDNYANLPRTDWFTDPLDDHQAWYYRQVVEDMAEYLREPDEPGDGDE